MKLNINGDKLQIAVKRHIKPELWSSSKTRAKGRDKDAMVLNKYLDALHFRAQAKYNELLTDGELSVHRLRDSILGINEARPKYLLEIWQDHLDRMVELLGKGTSKSNIQKYRTCKNHFANFLKRHRQCNDIALHQLNHKMIEDFEFYLKTDAGCGHNTTIKFLQNVKKITGDALKNGWLKTDPFVNKSLSLKDVARPYLNELELKKLRELNVSNTRLARIRDLFLFSCYTGLSYSDVKKLTRNELEIEGEEKWLKTHRAQSCT